MELMAVTQPENLIDLGQYPQNDVELIAREYMRCAYIDLLQEFGKTFAERDESDEERQNVIKTLESFEHTIAILDQSEDFLEFVHSGAEGEEESTEDDEFERF
ncbi:MAG: hypothetical protein ACPH54_07765 [Candidatus Poseidoniaceae archaeon]